MTEFTETIKVAVHWATIGEGRGLRPVWLVVEAPSRFGGRTMSMGVWCMQHLPLDPAQEASVRLGGEP